MIYSIIYAVLIGIVFNSFVAGILGFIHASFLVGRYFATYEDLENEFITEYLNASLIVLLILGISMILPYADGATGLDLLQNNYYLIIIGSVIVLAIFQVILSIFSKYSNLVYIATSFLSILLLIQFMQNTQELNIGLFLFIFGSTFLVPVPEFFYFLKKKWLQSQFLASSDTFFDNNEITRLIAQIECRSGITVKTEQIDIRRKQKIQTFRRSIYDISVKISENYEDFPYFKCYFCNEGIFLKLIPMNKNSSEQITYFLKFLFTIGSLVLFITTPLIILWFMIPILFVSNIFYLYRLIRPVNISLIEEDDNQVRNEHGLLRAVYWTRKGQEIKLQVGIPTFTAGKPVYGPQNMHTGQEEYF